MRNIIITGGGLVNKGAQAMSFITACELHQRFPNHIIYLLSTTDQKRTNEELSQYIFKIMGWYPMKFAAAQSNIILKLICSLKNHSEFKEAEEIYKNCDLMVDISGYSLGSNWSDKICNDYLDNIEFAKAFGIPVVLLPQSFGPFNFTGRERLENRIRNLLPGVKKIYSREKEGFDLLQKKYGLSNVELAPDIVLSNQKIDYQDAYIKIPELEIPFISDNSVALIPNAKIMGPMDEKSVYEMYINIVKCLLELNKKVYLISHSSGDMIICETIKKSFAYEERVYLLTKDYSCLEFNALIKQFSFCIASRFHSIVHALKNSVPCISIGWAVKYEELLSQFGQDQYVFDVRREICMEKLLMAICKLNECAQFESKKITNHLSLIEQSTVFDELESYIRY